MKKRRMRRSFEESVADYAKYCNSDGYLSASFITPKGYRVGQWGTNVRNGKIKLTPERKELLKEINFLWDVKAYQLQISKEKREKKEAQKSTERKGKKYKTFEEWLVIFDFWNFDGYIPVNFITPKCEKIGKWAAQIRFGQRKITERQREELNRRNFRWRVSQEERKRWLGIDFLEICIQKRRAELLKEKGVVIKR